MVPDLRICPMGTAPDELDRPLLIPMARHIPNGYPAIFIHISQTRVPAMKMLSFSCEGMYRTRTISESVRHRKRTVPHYADATRTLPSLFTLQVAERDRRVVQSIRGSKAIPYPSDSSRNRKSVEGTRSIADSSGPDTCSLLPRLFDLYDQ